MVYLALSGQWSSCPFLYFLRSSIYVNLTSKYVGTSLVSSRGPGFVMPERCNFQRIPSEDPCPGAIADAVSEAFIGSQFGNDVVFAGLGDPLLKLDLLLRTAERITESNPGKALKYRVVTNGLLESYPESLSSMMKQASIEKLTVCMNYPCSSSYDLNMLRSPPHTSPYHDPSDLHHATASFMSSGDAFPSVCDFVSSMSKQGMDVEVTAIDNGRADIDDVKDLAIKLGASAFNVRTWHE